MAKTPPHLRRFGIPEHVASRKLSRAYRAFRVKGKRKEFLSVAWAMEMSGALEQYGAPAQHSEARSQRLMAGMLGIDVSTFNRRLGQFSDPDGRWDDDRRRRHSEKMRAAAARRKQESASSKFDGVRPPETSQARAVAGGDTQSYGKGDLVSPSFRKMRSVHRLITLFNKNAQFGQAQLYTFRRPPDLKPQIEKKKGTDKPSDPELLVGSFGEEWFDADRNDLNGYKSVPGWVWHPKLPHVEKCECQSGQMGLQLSKSEGCSKCGGAGAHYRTDPMPDYGRVLMTYLLQMGLADKKKNYMVELTQEEISEDLGWDVNTTAKYEDMWEALTVIRCVAGAVHRDCLNCAKTYVDRCPTCGSTNGPVRKRDPHKILWLPDRLLDEEVAQREYARFQAVRDRVKDKVALDRAALVHAGLLKEWGGKEHSLEGFWSEMRRRLAAENVNKSIVDALFPFYRE